MASFKLFFLALAFVAISYTWASPMAELSLDMAEAAESAADDVTGNPIPLGTTEKYESAAEESGAEERQSSACIFYYWYGRTCRLCFWCRRFGSYSRCYYRSYC